MRAEVASREPTEATALVVNEIFLSIQGESTWAGLPCVFVRTTGCPLRCTWCDTEYAFYEGEKRQIDDLVAEVLSHDVDLVEITGGEPLAQAGVPKLARALLAAGRTVLCETSGAFDISLLPEGVHRIMDLKCPGSGECERNDLDNLARLRSGDELKFVIADRTDYDWALGMIREHDLAGRVPLLFSPVNPTLDPAELAAWMMADRAPARLQLQLHKLLWPGVERGI